jgi:hypothetical protein
MALTPALTDPTMSHDPPWDAFQQDHSRYRMRSPEAVTMACLAAAVSGPKLHAVTCVDAREGQVHPKLSGTREGIDDHTIETREGIDGSEMIAGSEISEGPSQHLCHCNSGSTVEAREDQTRWCHDLSCMPAPIVINSYHAPPVIDKLPVFVPTFKVDDSNIQPDGLATVSCTWSTDTMKCKATAEWESCSYSSPYPLWSDLTVNLQDVQI